MDFFPDYFTRDTKNGQWGVDDAVKSNTGEVYESAVELYAHPDMPSRYVYLLSKNHSSFSGQVFLAKKTASTKSSMVVRIYGDETLLWESPVFTEGSMPVDFDVDISGCAQMTIEAETWELEDYHKKYIAVYLGNCVLNP